MGEVDVVWMGTNLVDRFLEDTDDYVHSIGRFLFPHRNHEIIPK